MTAPTVHDDTYPPRGIKPQIGERVQLRLAGGGSHDYVVARLVGHLPGRSLLVALPETADQRLGMIEGKALDVRMLTGGNIFFFETTIQRVCVSPAHYLHLDWPAGVRAQQLRRSPWARIDLAGTVIASGQAEEFAHVRNLSPDGAQIEVSNALGEIGGSLRLAFRIEIDGLRADLSLDATLQHLHPARTAEGLLEYGLAFRAVPMPEALWLRCLVYQRIAEGHPA